MKPNKPPIQKVPSPEASRSSPSLSSTASPLVVASSSPLQPVVTSSQQSNLPVALWLRKHQAALQREGAGVPSHAGAPASDAKDHAATATTHRNPISGERDPNAGGFAQSSQSPEQSKGANRPLPNNARGRKPVSPNAGRLNAWDKSTMEGPKFDCVPPSLTPRKEGSISKSRSSLNRGNLPPRHQESFVKTKATRRSSNKRRMCSWLICGVIGLLLFMICITLSVALSLKTHDSRTGSTTSTTVSQPKIIDLISKSMQDLD